MVDREAIEAKARELEEALTETQEAVKSTAMMAAIGVAVALVLVYFFGKRKGKKAGARIEIHKL